MSDFDLATELRRYARDSFLDGTTCDWLDTAAHHIAALEAENVRLAAIVDRLPKTADGVLVSECEVLFLVHVDVDQPMAVRECVFDLVNKEAFVTFHKAQYMVSAHCYSTREAAEAAAKEAAGNGGGA